jgi:phage shock protein PspC (stress-responsive transcriptional regulator)
MTPPARLPLRRDTRNKVIAGVCAGIARRYGISRTGLRLAFVLSCVLPGPQFIAYLLLWIVIPGLLSSAAHQPLPPRLRPRTAGRTSTR